MASHDVTAGPGRDTTVDPSRLEFYEDSAAGTIVYVATDPDGVWARSEFPDELMTLDYDEQDRLIGIELIGDLAKAANEELLRTMFASMDHPELLKKALQRDAPGA